MVTCCKLVLKRLGVPNGDVDAVWWSENVEYTLYSKLILTGCLCEICTSSCGQPDRRCLGG